MEKGFGCPPWLPGSQARQGFAPGAEHGRSGRGASVWGGWRPGGAARWNPQQGGGGRT
ncbi:hypothetical protein Zm00014a_028458 [Zea mays]|uniref:Uncharacterized protein n=1 Tax=Zea mays TaxID=4577 RepID=A0A317YDA8_MAIZE|nr:hypothetical protein Zm00014a_028458 [Zea mays]